MVAASVSVSLTGFGLQVALQISDAVSQGAKLLKGGKRLQGSFVEPTLLTDVSAHMLCMQEETFGPLVPIVRLVEGGHVTRC